jgi:hypothetical protein
LRPFPGELGGGLLEAVGGFLVGHVVLAGGVELGPEPVEQLGGLVGDGRVGLAHGVTLGSLVAHARKHGTPQNRPTVR